MQANHKLIELMRQRLANGLQRSIVCSPSDWAARYRIMGGERPGPWTFNRHPWTRAIHDCTDEYIIVQKGAQLGIT